MSVRNREQIDNTELKRPKNILWLIIAVLVVFIFCILAWRFAFYRSPQEQLSAFNAASAVPDSENAAIIYNQLFEDYNESDLNPASLTPVIAEITKSGPWSSRDYPELAKWLEQNQDIIAKLLQASKYERCFFPITNMNLIMSQLAAMRQLVFTLIRAADNDFAEGRTDQALEKYLGCIRIGRHFRQQPLAIEFLVGIAIEALGTQKIRYLIMYEDITAEQMKTTETILPDTKFEFEKYWDEMLYAENLFSRTVAKSQNVSNLLVRLREWWANLARPDPALARVKEIYLRLLVDRQGSQILVALRHYKNKTGKWPEKLEEIKPFLTSEDILVDPQNKGSFVYRLKDDGFILYSTGLNKIDENGQRKSPADDWLIWPLQIPKAETQNTKANQADPNQEPKR